MKSPLFFAAMIVASAAPAPAAVPNAATLDVTITELRSTNGALIVCLWHDKAGFPTCQKSASAVKKRFPVTATAMRVRFDGLASGQYAVTVQHDEDGDGKLKTNFIGMPKEGVGTSNNPGGMPGFAKSLVQVTPGSAITVRMRYL